MLGPNTLLRGARLAAKSLAGRKRFEQFPVSQLKSLALRVVGLEGRVRVQEDWQAAGVGNDFRRTQSS